MLGLLLSELSKDEIIAFLIYIIPTNGNVVNLSPKISRVISRSICDIISLYIFSLSTTPLTYTLCLVILQIRITSLIKHVPHWLSLFLIILSNDIHVNPGPQFQNNFLNFMLWNLNSLAKDNFARVRLLEAHNSIFNYDLISICETSLNNSVELPETLLNDYTFIPASNPTNARHGGVGLFYKNSLPILIRNNLAFDESIVVELKFGRKKIFFTVLYRSPAHNHTSVEFQAFMTNFESLFSKIKSENPFTMFFYR